MWEPCDAAHVWAAIEKRPCLPIAQVCQPNEGVRLQRLLSSAQILLGRLSKHNLASTAMATVFAMSCTGLLPVGLCRDSMLV